MSKDNDHKVEFYRGFKIIYNHNGTEVWYRGGHLKSFNSSISKDRIKNWLFDFERRLRTRTD